MPTLPRNSKVILESMGIPFIEEGKNVKRGNVCIHCPYCGSLDPSFHLGINIKNGRWSCWRNASHRGKDLAGLISKVCHIPYKTAHGIVWSGLRDRKGFKEQLQDILDKMTQEEKPKPIPWPKQFVPIMEKDRFWEYMRTRGYNTKALRWVLKNYPIYKANTGNYKDRVIFPIYDLSGNLTGWVGRAIGASKRRYMMEKWGNYGVLFRNRIAYGGRALVICEGPFDSLRVDYLGRNLGIHSTALFSTNIKPSLIRALRLLSNRYDTMVVLLDKGEETNSIKVALEVGAKVIPLRTVKDPALLGSLDSVLPFIDQ